MSLMAQQNKNDIQSKEGKEVNLEDNNSHRKVMKIC